MADERVPAADYVVGFTGSREGMTPMQRLAVASHLMDEKFTEGHHGDCVGADADFDRMARLNDVRIVVHPPSDSRLRAWCEGEQVCDEKPYLDRNRDIVNASDVLLATPKESMEARKGGTWYTVHYARQQGKRVVIIWPDGTHTSDGAEHAD